VVDVFVGVLREGDFVVWLGGDEFAVLLLGVGLDVACWVVVCMVVVVEAVIEYLMLVSVGVCVVLVSELSLVII